jgi:hypothetical protein
MLSVVSACTASNNDGVAPLVNGYKIWMMNSKEIYVGAPDDVLLVGPKLEELALVNSFIVGKCSLEDITINGFRNTKGYFLIDTKKKSTKVELSKEHVLIELKKLGIKELPTLKSVKEYF